MKIPLPLLGIFSFMQLGVLVAGPVKIGTESLVPEHPRSIYNRYVNWRPADGETVHLNPPRISWPYRADWPEKWGNASHSFRLQIATTPAMANPVVDAESFHNFYNAIPALKGTDKWYWRVGYDIGSKTGKWSETRSFTIAPDAIKWDREKLAKPAFAEKGHPRILMSKESLPALRKLAKTNSASKATLEYMRKRADAVLKRDWWDKLPETDMGKFPKQAFYRIAEELALVCFVWKMTGDERYAEVKANAVKWASYPPGGRSSPEGLGGDGHEDATQGNEFLALLFDWLYNDLNEDERQTMIRSLEWRTNHIMHNFSWSRLNRGGAMIRLTFRGAQNRQTNHAFEAEAATIKNAKVATNAEASTGKVVVITAKNSEISQTLQLEKGTYVVRVRGCGPEPNQDAFYVRIDDQKPRRIHIKNWGEGSAHFPISEPGNHTLRITADPGEIGMMIDHVQVVPHGDERIWLSPAMNWQTFEQTVAVPAWAREAVVELFNYYAAGEVLWSNVKADNEGRNLLRNSTLQTGQDKAPKNWEHYAYRTQSSSVYLPEGNGVAHPAMGTNCPDAQSRGSWGQTIKVAGLKSLRLYGSYRARIREQESVRVTGGMGGMISSHPYESTMDTMACGLALYEHSPIGKKWYELSSNYLAGVTTGHGFDEAWNEGAGYGTSKCKWLVNASLYYDTALEGNFGRNPFYSRLGEWFRRIIPVGMTHHAWGNQANASRYNHLSHFRKLAHLTGDGRFLYNWKAYGGKEFSTFRPWIEYVLPHFYPEPEAQPETQNAELFPIAGWAMAASAPPSDPRTFKEGTGVIFQCRPRGGYGHSFNSDASFQLHAFGQMLNHGGGSSGNGDAYAYHTMSHNTLLIDGLGQAQPSKGMLYPTYGRIVGFRKEKDFVYMAGDPTRCYPRKPGNFSRWSLPLDRVYQQRALPQLQHFVRHILFVKNRYFVIYDDISCSKPSTYTWLYHIQPEAPFTFDGKTFAIDYRVGDVNVRLQHLAQPGRLALEDRQGLDAYVNPITGEDYRRTCKKKNPCGHNLWISNLEPKSKWSFLAVVFPTKPGEKTPTIEALGNTSVRIGDDKICFDPAAPEAQVADIVIDTGAFQPK